MSAPFSIIIPTLNAGESLPACLDSLLPGLDRGLIREVIVSDGGSGDATPTIADDAGARFIRGEPGRGGQLRRGAGVAKGAWLLFLHADSVLDPDWPGAAATHITSGEAAAFRLRFDAGGLAAKVVAAWANWRSQRFGLPYGDQGLLISRDLYDAVGGFNDQPLMEDVAMARALKGRLQLLDCHITTGAEKYRKRGWLRQGTSNLVTLARYMSGTSPEQLAAEYQKR